MILTIDIGNTTITLGGLQRSGSDYDVIFTAKLETDSSLSTDAYREAILLRLQENGRTPEEFEGICASSVVPKVMEAIEAAVEAIWNRKPLIITAQSDLGITVDVPEPDKVGRDRLVDSAWAAAHYPLPIVTADMGTATTFNVITKDRVFCGGVIAAGMETGLKALGFRTAQLPKLELRQLTHIIGRNTEECMLTGAIAGTAAVLDGIVLDIEEELGMEVSFVFTGGGAKYAHRFVRHPHIWEPEMMLKGLAYLYDRNK